MKKLFRYFQQLIFDVDFTNAVDDAFREFSRVSGYDATFVAPPPDIENKQEQHTCNDLLTISHAPVDRSCKRPVIQPGKVYI